MIELLELGAGHGWDRLRVAVEQTLSTGCRDDAAIRHLLTAEQLNRPAIPAIEIGDLARYERRLPVMNGYALAGVQRFAAVVAELAAALAFAGVLAFTKVLTRGSLRFR
jgi:hypothetical protein